MSKSMWDHVTSGDGLVLGLWKWAGENRLCPCQLVERVLRPFHWGDEHYERFPWAYDLGSNACMWIINQIPIDDEERETLERLNSDPMMDEDPFGDYLFLDEFDLF